MAAPQSPGFVRAMTNLPDLRGFGLVALVIPMLEVFRCSFLVCCMILAHHRQKSFAFDLLAMKSLFEGCISEMVFRFQCNWSHCEGLNAERGYIRLDNESIIVKE